MSSVIQIFMQGTTDPQQIVGDVEFTPTTANTPSIIQILINDELAQNFDPGMYF